MGSYPARRGDPCQGREQARKWERFGRLLQRRAARRHAPHLVGEPFEPLLRVVELRGGHLLGTPGDLPRVREQIVQHLAQRPVAAPLRLGPRTHAVWIPDRKSTRLNSSHGYISYAVFCLKKKKKKESDARDQHNQEAQSVVT